MLSRFSPQALPRIIAIAMTVVLLLAFMAIPVFADEGLFIVLPEQIVELDFFADLDVSYSEFYFLDSDFVVGDKFRIIIDGVSYICDLKCVRGMYYIGNLRLLDIVSGSNDFVGLYTDENFVIVPFDLNEAGGLCVFSLFGQHESVTLEISLYERAPGEQAVAVTTSLLDVIISIISWEAVLAIMAGILGVTVVLAFSWWAARKGTWLLMNAFRRGKIRI